MDTGCKTTAEAKIATVCVWDDVMLVVAGWVAKWVRNLVTFKGTSTRTFSRITISSLLLLLCAPYSWCLGCHWVAGSQYSTHTRQDSLDMARRWAKVYLNYSEEIHLDLWLVAGGYDMVDIFCGSESVGTVAEHDINNVLRIYVDMT